jgi:4-amino-4-deoxy-L-arabinose transferase-like glycosyltransferase
MGRVPTDVRPAFEPDPGIAPAWPRRLGLALLVLLAVGLRLAAVVQYEANHPLADAPGIDERSYLEWGAELAGGDWLGDEVFFQEPLYPYFLGAVFSVLGEDLHALRVVQCLLGGLTTLLVWRLTRRVFGRAESWIAGLAFALHPPAVLLPCLLLKPNLFLPLLAWLAELLVRPGEPWRRFLGVGALAGLGALLRGNLLVLLPVLALWPLVRARIAARDRRGPAWRASAAFVVGALLVLAPVAVRNGLVGGVWALTTSGAGTNVYGGNNADNPLGVATEFDWVRGIPEYEAGDWRREAERRLGRELDAGEVSSYWLGQVAESLRRDPALHARILWTKWRLAWGAYEVPDNHHLGWDARFVPVLRGLLVAGEGSGFALLGGLGLGGLLLALLRGRLRGPRGELALLFLAYTGTIVLTVMSMRARLPLVVLLFPFTGSLAVEVWRGYVRDLDAPRARGWLPAVLCGLAGVALTSLPVVDAEGRARDLADRDHNLVVSWLERGERLEQASALAADLVARYPRSSRLQTLLADTEWRRGRAALEAGEERAGQEAIRAALVRLRAVVEAEGVAPRERSRALRLAAYVQADLGDWEKAERFFRRAREFASEDLELRVSHGQALLEAARAGAEGAEDLRAEGRALLEGVVAEDPGSVPGRAAAGLLAEMDAD